MKPLKVGIVGCGVISVQHIKGWRRAPGAVIGGLLDLNREQAQKRAAEFGISRVYDSFEQLVDDCDIVDVITPPSSHAALSLKVIEAKKHLMIEKPVVTDAADWDALARAMKSSPTKMCVIHNLKFSASSQTAKQWVDQGRIGNLIRMQREFLTSPKTDRMLVGDNHWSHRLPGGRWYETLPHELYLFHWFGGPLELGSVTIQATANAPSGAPADEVIVTMRGERVLASMHFSANCDVNRRWLTLHGSHGCIEVDTLSDLASLRSVHDAHWKRRLGLAWLQKGQELSHAVSDRVGYGVNRLRGVSAHTRAIELFARHLAGEVPEPTPFEEVDYVIRNCDRIGREIDRQLALLRPEAAAAAGR
jgi:predicted dehydrogenase